jgi:hypothetical protein
MFIVTVMHYCLDGIIDAFAFHKAGISGNHDNNILKIDIHKYKLLQRSITLGLVFFILQLDELINAVGLIIGLSLLQPFVSNGVYFYIRNKLDSSIYVNGFITTKIKDDSTAIIDIDSFSTRCILAIVGIGIFIIFTIW